MTELDKLSQQDQDRLANATGAHSFQISKETMDAKNAVEYRVVFRDFDSKKHQLFVWVNNEDVTGDRKEYVEGLVVDAVKGVLSRG